MWKPSSLTLPGGSVNEQPTPQPVSSPAMLAAPFCSLRRRTWRGYFGLLKIGWFAGCGSLFDGWHLEFRPHGHSRRPARGDGFELGVETHPFHPVHRMVAEHRVFPAAEAVKRHRHRNRHIDSDHTRLHAAGKFACGLAVAG